LNRVAIFAAALFAIQTLEKTPIYFSAGCALFILIAAFAFNAAGGLTRASGAYVFCYSILVVLIGICYKAFLGEPAQSNLLAPQTTIAAYVASITAMYAAVFVSRRLSRKSGLLQNSLRESRMHHASVGCIAFGILGFSFIELLDQSGGQLVSAFRQLDALVPLGVIIGVMYEIRRSGGKRTINLPVVLGCLYMFINGGIINFSKQAMLTPLVCLILPVCALRVRISIAHAILILLAVIVTFRYLVPYSQYGRDQVPEGATMSQRMDVVIPLIEHPDETRRKYLEQQEEEEQNTAGLGGRAGAYYNAPQGFWDRLQFVSVDDELINFTDQGHVFGLMPIEASFLNVIPHFLWKNKPTWNFGNLYFHEMGGLSEDDTTTGIAFSPTGEAYHLAKWTGILVVAPLLWCLFFFVFDSLLGDLRASPWGLLALALIAHLAPEGGLGGLIYFLSFGVEMLVFCALFANWVAPIFAIPILGPDRKRTERWVIPSLPQRRDEAAPGVTSRIAGEL
jgi:hypothetical protein